jgi:hypothetical protein
MPLHIQDVREIFKNTQPRIKALLAGPPGAGKTLLASTWPNVLYADLEGRLLSVRNRDVKATRIESLSDLEQLATVLDQLPDVRQHVLGFPVETVVLDTVDELARLIVKERLRSERVDAMRIQDWGYLADTLRNLLRGFRNIADLHVIFNVHLKTIEDSETGRVEYRPAIQGAVGHEIAEYVDEAWLLSARPVLDQKTGEKKVMRYLQTYPDAQHDWIKDHSGALPMEIPLNFADDYQRISDLIFGAPAAPAATIAPPAPEAPTEPSAPPAPQPKPASPPPDEPPPAPPTTPPSDTDTETETDQPRCAVCNDVIVPVEYAQIGRVRFGEELCRVHCTQRLQGTTPQIAATNA